MQQHITNRQAVSNLQRYLRRLSYEENGILPIPIDGIFDSRTEEALSEFQRMMGVPVTGRADKVTWDALFGEYERLLRKEDLRRSPDLFPRVPPDYQTTLGETGAFISLLQFMLNELTAHYDTLSLLPVTGSYDGATADAVTEFQRIHGLPQSGRVNRNTWNRLSEEYNQYAT
ncbi:MAG: peptidoglycan-binding protein [Clostridia bacterium]|nr:peptidoglycan-binding protein [Clostridia bacterium]